MGKYAQFVVGPAGSGKTSYCRRMVEHLEAIGRRGTIVNLDFAADESVTEAAAVDVRDLISLDDAMEVKGLGPNGGLVFCMEFLADQLDWLDEQLGEYEDDYLLVDCPGQIELYTHSSVMVRVIQHFEHSGYRVCAVFLLDAHFLTDAPKFFSGIMVAMSTMYQLSLPHVNLLSKMDLPSVREERLQLPIEDFLFPNVPLLLNELHQTMHPRFKELNEALAGLIDEESVVAFTPFSIRDDESVEAVLSVIDNVLQFGEDEEPHDPEDHDPDHTVDVDRNEPEYFDE